MHVTKFRIRAKQISLFLGLGHLDVRPSLFQPTGDVRHNLDRRTPPYSTQNTRSFP